MSEPTWELLGGGGVVGGPIDYVGDWAAAVTYEPGKVVRYLGVDYLCVNTALGQIPGAAAGSAPIGISLPASPVDGQRFTLVDSLTAPTYAWEFMYVAGITDAYKWVFIGGHPAQVTINPSEPIAAATSTWQNCTTVGPDFAVPRAGHYQIDFAATGLNSAVAGLRFIGIANASLSPTPLDPTAGLHFGASEYGQLASRTAIGSVGAGQTLRMQYWADSACNFRFRVMAITPMRVA